MTFFQKCLSKFTELSNFFVVFVSPEKGLFEIAFGNWIVGVIFGVNTVGDHKELDIAKQAIA